MRVARPALRLVLTGSLITGAAPAGAAEKYVIAVQARRMDGGAALVGGVLRVEGGGKVFTAKTDRQGVASVKVPGDVRYEVVITKEGYGAASLSLHHHPKYGAQELTYRAYLVSARRHRIGADYCTDFTRYRTSQGPSIAAVDAALAEMRAAGPGRIASYFTTANKAVPTYNSCLARLRAIRAAGFLEIGRHAEARDELLSLDETLFAGGYGRLLGNTDRIAAAADLELLLTKARGLDLLVRAYGLLADCAGLESAYNRVLDLTGSPTVSEVSERVPTIGRQLSDLANDALTMRGVMRLACSRPREGCLDLKAACERGAQGACAQQGKFCA
ncbi:MAG: hypothetical protein R3325_09070 [Thermoanaerobaculia bacterium]|nr:hypothetical protein [Thermoanaerobaculia bacterium]